MRRAVVLVVGVLVAVLAVSAQVGAVPVDQGAPGGVGEETALVFDRLGVGQGVIGFLPPPDSSFDPVTDAYPTSNPSGWGFRAEDYAGTLIGEPPGGGAGVQLYCIDLLTITAPGYGYDEGSWDASNVPNVGYVARALNLYYPSTNEPASLSAAAKAAAVQATIWFFSDDYVLATADPLHATVAAMTAEVKALGPLPEPAPPALSLTPSSAAAPWTRSSDPSPWRPTIHSAPQSR